jgi:hypothetical protein
MEERESTLMERETHSDPAYETNEMTHSMKKLGNIHGKKENIFLPHLIVDNNSVIATTTTCESATEES